MRDVEKPGILLVGGTGALGHEIAERLSGTATPFRALVRPETDDSALVKLGAAVVRGDLREPASLDRAVEGIRVVISSANTMARGLAGRTDLTIHDVDDVGYANLIAACERAAVQRFVFASLLGDMAAAHTPFTDAKAATERRLQASPLREVIVRSDMFQEIWFTPLVGFDWAHGKVTLYGHGDSRHAYVGIGDLADAMVRLAVATDPPRVVDIAGPELMSREEAVSAFERATGRTIRTTHIPRIVLSVGRRLLRGPKPFLASVMGMALQGDLEDTTAHDEALVALGIHARPVSRYIAELTAAPAANA